MTYNVSSGTLNPTIPYHTILRAFKSCLTLDYIHKLTFYAQHVGWLHGHVLELWLNDESETWRQLNTNRKPTHRNSMPSFQPLA